MKRTGHLHHLFLVRRSHKHFQAEWGLHGDEMPSRLPGDEEEVRFVWAKRVGGLPQRCLLGVLQQGTKSERWRVFSTVRPLTIAGTETCEFWRQKITGREKNGWRITYRHVFNGASRSSEGKFGKHELSSNVGLETRASDLRSVIKAA